MILTTSLYSPSPIKMTESSLDGLGGNINIYAFRENHTETDRERMASCTDIKCAFESVCETNIVPGGHPLRGDSPVGFLS